MLFHFFLLPLLYAKCKFLLGIGSSSYSTTYSFCKEYDSISVLFCSFCIDIYPIGLGPLRVAHFSALDERSARAL